MRTGLNVDASIVRVHDLADDGKAEARTLGLGREEGIENPVAQLARDARPVVGHVHDDRARRERVAEGHMGVFLEHAFARRNPDVSLPSRASKALISRFVNSWQS